MNFFYKMKAWTHQQFNVFLTIDNHRSRQPRNQGKDQTLRLSRCTPTWTGKIRTCGLITCSEMSSLPGISYIVLVINIFHFSFIFYKYCQDVPPMYYHFSSGWIKFLNFESFSECFSWFLDLLPLKLKIFLHLWILK